MPCAALPYSPRPPASPPAPPCPRRCPNDRAVPEPFRGIVTEADYRANLDAAAPSFEASILTGDQVSYMAGSPCAGSLIAFQNAMAKGRST